MYQSVTDRFLPMVEELDGLRDHMYTDAAHRVHIGSGIMIDSVGSAQMLSWRWRDTNRRATAGEIKHEWIAIKAQARKEWMTDQPKQSQLYLPRQDARRAALNKFLSIDEELLSLYPEYKRWPAEAQMATIQALWVNIDLDGVKVALRGQTFALAAGWFAAHGTSTKRTALIIDLYRTAGMVVEVNAVRSTFWYPGIPQRPGSSANSDRIGP